MSPTTDTPRCPAHGGPEYSPCEKPAGHPGAHYAWLGGYGPVQWPNKESSRV